MGFNSKVQRHSFGIKDLSEYSRITEGAAAREYERKQVLKENQVTIDRHLAEDEKAERMNEFQSKSIMHGLVESQALVNIHKIEESCRNGVFKDLLYSLFENCLYLDEDFIVAKEGNLRDLINTYVDEKGGYIFLKESYRRNKSPFLKALIEACDKTTMKVTKRKLKEAKDSGTAEIKFDLDDEENNDIDLEKKNMHMDELSDLVKQKVLTVVQDEKVRQQKQEELEQDLTDQQEAGKIKENFSVFHSPVEESTLFDSLFRSSCKEAMESASAINSSLRPDDDAEETEKYDISATNQDVQIDHDSTFDAPESENVISDIDMDLALVESITKYTLMEMLYTIQLENYNFKDIQKISQNLLN